MLVGMGIDLVAVRDFADLLADPASGFVAATFTAGEVDYSRKAVSGEPARHLAGRYAAKEAALKALDTACALAGLTPPRVPLTDLEVTRDEAGRPHLNLHGEASRLAERLGADRAWVSLSHDGDYATAVVAFERLT